MWRQSVVDCECNEEVFYVEGTDNSVGCGLCGIESIEEAMRSVPETASEQRFTAAEITGAVGELYEFQELHKATGAVHAAGFYIPGKGVVAAREDVGRHNALDKLIGRALLDDRLPLSDCIVMLSGRASYELLQKSVMAGVPIVCAVSAPSSYAVALAEQFGVTLVGFLRGDRFNVYSHVERVCGAS